MNSLGKCIGPVLACIIFYPRNRKKKKRLFEELGLVIKINFTEFKVITI